MRKCTKSDLKGLEEDHVCESCGKLIHDAKIVYVKEYEFDNNEYYCEECVSK